MRRRRPINEPQSQSRRRRCFGRQRQRYRHCRNGAAAARRPYHLPRRRRHLLPLRHQFRQRLRGVQEHRPHHVGRPVRQDFGRILPRQGQQLRQQMVLGAAGVQAGRYLLHGLLRRRAPRHSHKRLADGAVPPAAARADSGGNEGNRPLRVLRRRRQDIHVSCPHSGQQQHICGRNERRPHED